MKRILSRISHGLRSRRFQRRIATVILAVGLLIAAFYAEENWRGSRFLAETREDALRAGVPMSLLEACQEGKSQDRNLYFSPVVQRRIIRQDPSHWSSTDARPVIAGWGLLTDRVRRDAFWNTRPKPADNRRADMAAFRTIITANGWEVPAGLPPAEAVLHALRRFEDDLTEWATALRERPDWQILAADFGLVESFHFLLLETGQLFALRAIAAANAGRSGTEIVSDLESAALLDLRIAAYGSVIPDTVWEILGTGALTDSEWAAVQALLVTAPQFLPWVEWMEEDSLYQIENFPQPLGQGHTLSEEIAKERADRSRYDSPWKQLHLWLAPQGWYRMDEGARWSRMAEMRRRATALQAAQEAATELSGWSGECKVAAFPAIRYYDSRLKNHDSRSDTFSLDRATGECGAAMDYVITRTHRPRLAMAAIAVHRWHREHGTWPDSLESAAALTPGAPDALQGVRYQKTETGVRLKTGTDADRSAEEWTLPVTGKTPPVATSGGH